MRRATAAPNRNSTTTATGTNTHANIHISRCIAFFTGCKGKTGNREGGYQT